MQRDFVVEALNECSRAALRATNGHHRRWAVARCVRELVAQGTSPTLAERCALAGVAVAQHVSGVAQREDVCQAHTAWMSRRRAVISDQKTAAQSTQPDASR